MFSSNLAIPAARVELDGTTVVDRRAGYSAWPSARQVGVLPPITLGMLRVP